MSYKVVRETKWGEITIRGGFKSEESANMFLTEYRKEAPHIPGKLNVKEEVKKSIAVEVIGELWQRR